MDPISDPAPTAAGTDDVVIDDDTDAADDDDNTDETPARQRFSIVPGHAVSGGANGSSNGHTSAIAEESEDSPTAESQAEGGNAALVPAKTVEKVKMEEAGSEASGVGKDVSKDTSSKLVQEEKRQDGMVCALCDCH